MNPLPDLISRLQSATGPDRELDEAIGNWLWSHGDKKPWECFDYGPDGPGKKFTASIDVALTLLPNNLAVHEMGHVHPDRREWYVYIVTSDQAWQGRHAVPAIAMCITALKTIAAKTPGEAEPQ